MNIIEIKGPLEADKQKEIQLLHEEVFEIPMRQKLVNHINKQVALHTVLAYENDALVGFKIGCVNLNGNFYSWLGGVSNKHRRKGIARELLKRQHDWAQELGHKSIETQAAGNNSAMLILNLSEGYHIMGTTQGSNGDIVVSLRKQLGKS